MAQTFKEKAHLNTNREKFDEGFERIFGNKDKEEKPKEETNKGEDDENTNDL